jgi:hypothetical protein
MTSPSIYINDLTYYVIDDFISIYIYHPTCLRISPRFLNLLRPSTAFVSLSQLGHLSAFLFST